MAGVPGAQPSLGANPSQSLHDGIIGQLIRRVDDTICTNTWKDVFLRFQGPLKKYVLQEAHPSSQVREHTDFRSLRLSVDFILVA
jgi:hypothetical protein